MRAGRLADRVTIQQRQTNEGEYGDPVNAYTNTATRKCDIQPLNGKEFFNSRADVNSINYRIRFRYEKGLLQNGYRLVDSRVSPNRIFDIETVINDKNRNVELICMCIERTYAD